MKERRSYLLYGLFYPQAKFLSLSYGTENEDN